jgi:hypothetical protein
MEKIVNAPKIVLTRVFVHEGEDDTFEVKSNLFSGSEQKERRREDEVAGGGIGNWL